jgi:lysophospholipase L1-like esterase
MSGALLAGCASAPPPVSDTVQKYYDEHNSVAPPATQQAVDKVPTAPGTVSVVFGDSWTAGYSAAPSSNGYAYKLADAMGWQNTVEGVAGTGFVNVGPNKEGTYAARLATMKPRPDVQLLVLQGGLNDASQRPDAFRLGVLDALSAAGLAFPAAKIVILGPASPTVPVGPELSFVNSTLYEVAQTKKLNYISPINSGWIDASNVMKIIDPKTGHPNPAGHAFLAEKTAAAMRAISQ